MNKIIKILFFISVLFSFQNLIAQTQPSGILFQAVARDASNNAAVNRTIYAIVEIREVTSTGSTVYSESHQVLSNDEGIFNLIIGNGTRLSGATKFDNLNWRSQIYFINLKVAIAPSLPTPGWDLSKEYVDMGTSQIWAVPYAFSAFKAVIADSATKFGGVLAGESGGTGINNIGKTITLGRNFEIQGLGNLKFNTTGLTSLTLPQNGRLINADGVDTLSNKYIISPILLGKPTTPTADSLSSDSSIANIKYVKASISNQIAVLKGQISGVIDSSSGLRLKISDTSAMLTNRLTRDTSFLLQKRDTITLSNRIDNLTSSTTSGTNLKLNISDTSVMLSNRIERDTISLSNRINTKVNTLNARVDSSLYVNGKVRIDSVLTLNDSLRVIGNVLIDSNLTIKGKLSIDGGFNFRDSLTVARGARIDSSLLLKGKLLLVDSLLAKGVVKIDSNLFVKSLNVSDSIQRFSDSIANLSNRVGAISSSSNKFTADLKVNYGGGSFGKYTNGQTIPAIGKTIDEVFKDILTKVISPSYSSPTASLNMPSSGLVPSGTAATGNIEIGTNLGTLTFNPTFNKLDGGDFSAIAYKKNGSFFGSSSDNVTQLTAQITYQVTYTYSAGSSIKKNNLNEDDVTNQVQAGTVNSNTVTITPASYKYWGMTTNSSANITDADIIAMVGGNKEWATSKLKSSFTITGPGGSGPVKYAFYAVPSATSGTITSILAGGFESIAAFDKVTRSFTNAQGYVVSYDIYVQKNSGTDNVTLIIN
jgi:hypothetical protein